MADYDATLLWPAQLYSRIRAPAFIREGLGICMNRLENITPGKIGKQVEGDLTCHRRLDRTGPTPHASRRGSFPPSI